MKRLSVPPYHIFKVGTRHFVHDLSCAATLEITEPLFDLLGQRDAIHAGVPQVAVSLVSKKHGEEVAHTVVHEFNLLCDQGLFRRWIAGPAAREDEDLIRKTVKRGTNKIQLFLARDCNLRCRYCYAVKQRALEPRGVMSVDIAAAAVDLLFQRAGNSNEVCVTFMGGEPLINRDVFHWVTNTVVARARQEGRRARFSLTTNATLLTDDVIGQIRKHNFGLMISMDGPPDIHDANRPMRSGSGSHSRTLDGVKRLMQFRRSVTARCTVAHGFVDKPRIIAALADTGFTRIAMGVAGGTAEAKGPADITEQEWHEFDEQDQRLFEEWIRCEPIQENAPYNPFVKAIRRVMRPEMNRIRCGMARGCTTVDTDGSLYPCHRYVGMEGHVIGDAWNGVSAERHTAELRGYLKTLRKCESCWALKLCGGACPWYVACEEGSSAYMEPDDFHCRWMRRYFERATAWASELRERHPDYFNRVIVGEK